MTVPFRYRIAAVILLLETVMMGAVLWVTLNHAVDSATRQIEAAERGMLNIISNIARVSLLNEDYDYIQGHIESLPDNPAILKAILADEQGTIVATSTLTDLGATLPKLINTPDKHWHVMSIQNAAGRLGTLAVLFSTAERNAIYHDALNRGILIAVTGMTAIAIFSIGFGHLLTRRLDAVVDAANQVAKGNYTVRTGLRRDDEVGRVGKAFDTMADVIAAERQVLSDNNIALEQAVEERTRKLVEANQEYEAFAYAVSHDLRSPLRTINGFSEILIEEYGQQLDDTAQNYLQRISKGSVRMSRLIDDLLTLSRVNRAKIRHQKIDLSALCGDIINELREQEPGREVDVVIDASITATGDPYLLRAAMVNLLGNAWKFTGKTENARIHVEKRQVNGAKLYCVIDNGAGFDPAYANKLFTPFQRLHTDSDFPGTGIGLSTVQRIIVRHDGEIHAKGEVGKGATFSFTLGEPHPDDDTPAT